MNERQDSQTLRHGSWAKSATNGPMDGLIFCAVDQKYFSKKISKIFFQFFFFNDFQSFFKDSSKIFQTLFKRIFQGFFYSFLLPLCFVSTKSHLYKNVLLLIQAENGWLKVENVDASHKIEWENSLFSAENRRKSQKMLFLKKISHFYKEWDKTGPPPWFQRFEEAKWQKRFETLFGLLRLSYQVDG